MDGQLTHGQIMLLSHTPTMRGSDVARLVEFRSGLGGDSVADRWRVDGRIKNVALVHPYQEGKFG